MKHVRCAASQSVFDACKEHFGADYELVTRSGGVQHPDADDMVGTVTVRPGEAFAVVPRNAWRSSPRVRRSDQERR